MNNLFAICLGLSILLLHSGVDHNAESTHIDHLIKVERTSQRDIIDMDRAQSLIVMDQLIPGDEYVIHFSDRFKGLTYDVQINKKKVKLQGSNQKTFQFKPKYSRVEFDIDFLNFGMKGTKQLYITTSNQSAAEREAKLKQSEKSMVNPPVVTNGLPADELVTEVFIQSSCFEVENITFNGAGGNIGIGKFEEASTFAFKEGVIMGCFNVTQVVGPNSGTGTGGFIGGVVNDPDLQDLAGGIPVNDGQILEFDFIPTVDQMSFNYVWGSEEYCDYVDVAFNDVFGFFLSGPGINGPYTNNAENIALIPGTNTPVSINEVNWNDNSEYYITNNVFGGGTCTPGELAADPEAPDDIELDGWTERLTAVADVIPCETYHIKLAVGDGQDAVFGSAVFLEANSFFIGNNIDFEVNYSSPDADFVYENCGNDEACIRFYRGNEVPDTVDVAIPITEDISSQATEGVDYEFLPDTIIFPAGEIEVEICIEVIDDDILEGIELAVFLIENICACADPLVEIAINDVPPLLPDINGPTEVCLDEQVTITTTVNDDAPPDVTYMWSTGGTTPSITDQVFETTTYFVTITDGCEQEEVLEHTVEVIPRPSADLTGEGVLCATNSDCVDLSVEFTGTGPWNLTYSFGGQNFIVNGIASNPYTLVACEPGTYILTNVEAFGCDGDVVGSVTLDETEIQLSFTAEDALCADQASGNINLDIAGGFSPYTFTWNPDLGNVEDPQGVPAGTYAVTVTDDNGCTQETQAVVGQPEPLVLVDYTVTPVGCEGPMSGAIDITVIGGTGDYTFNWSDPAPDVEDPSNIELGGYIVTITDENDCILVSDVILVNLDNSSPVALAGPDTSLTCLINLVPLSGIASSPQGDPVILWTTTDGNIVSGEQTLSPMVDAPGTYTLTVSNPDGTCTTYDNLVVTEDNLPPQVDAGPEITINCSSTVVNLEGSSDPNTTIQWSTPDGNIVSGSSTLNPMVDLPGTYIVDVTNDVTGCVNSDQVTVVIDTVPPLVAIENADILTCQKTEITLSGNGSSEGPNIEYSWTTNDGNITTSNTGIDVDVDEPGTYTLTVRNSDNGCEEVLDIVVDEDVDELQIDIVAPDVLTCEKTIVDIDASNSEQNINSTILWNANAGGNIVSGIDSDVVTVDRPGEYIMTLTDTLTGCVSTEMAVVDELLTEPVAEAGTAEMLTCFVTEVMLNGSSNYPNNEVEFDWTTPNGSITSGSDTQNPIVSIAGTYILNVKYLGTGCEAIDSVIVIADENIPQIEVVNTTPVLTCNVTELNLDIDLTGNVSNFDVQWVANGGGNIISGEDTENPMVDQPGSYTVTVIDTVLGCITSASVDVTIDDIEPFAVAGNDDALTCDKVTLNLDGSQSSSGGEFQYSWSTVDGNILNGANQINPEVDQPGTYVLEVLNTNNGCISVDQVIVDLFDTQPVAMAISNDVLTCNIENVILDGSMSIGNGPLTYSWSTIDGNIVSGSDIEFPVVNQPGTYNLMVTNTMNGCTSDISVEVQQNIQDPTAYIITPDILNCSTNSVMVEGTGSSTGVDYQYLWTSSDGNIISSNNTLDIEVDQPGTYTLTVLDLRNGCLTTTNMVVTEDLNTPDAAIDQPEILTCDVETVTLDGTSSSQGTDYIYEWMLDGVFVGNTITVDVDASGSYTLMVTDQRNGCTSLTSVEVMEDRNDPEAQFDALDPDCDEILGDIIISNMVGQAPFSISIDGGVTYSENTNFSNLQPGIYDVHLRDATGCSIIEQLEIEENIPLESALAANTVVIGLSESYQIDLTLNLDPSEIASIVWTPESGLSCTTCEDPIASPETTTEYTVQIISEKGCIVEDKVFIRVDDTPLIYVPNVFSPNEDGSNDRFTIFSKEGHVNMIQELLVFDRWGNRLFENFEIPPNSIDDGWDGTYRAEELNPGVYVFSAVLELADGRLHRLVGDITLMR